MQVHAQNCNEQLGVRNSILISEYISLNPIVRPFLIFLKVWAKQRRLNDPSGQKGLMSLSSYSLVLMAIAYLQHAGIVPNLQEHALISQHGVSRQTFWSKVPNPDAPKAGHWTKRKFLGDYKAMAIDTTFVKAAQLIPQAQVPAASIASTDVKANASKAKSAATGWDSESETPVEKGIEVSRNPTQLLKLLEGFFEYYLGFPIENKAISVWRGKPIDRRVPFDDANQSSKKPRRLSRALRKAADHSSLSEDSGESGPSQQERNDGPSSDNVNDQRRLSDGETTATSETNTITDDEELRALYEKMEDTMRKLGVKDDTPSFELTLKSRKPSKKKKLSKGINGHNEGEEVTLPAMQEIDALEQLEGGDIGGSASSVHKGLDLSQASRDTNLFPIPPVEDPENFVEPPTWTQPLVVQDPFIHTRNTTMNIVPETVNLIWKVSGAMYTGLMSVN